MRPKVFAIALSIVAVGGGSARAEDATRTETASSHFQRGVEAFRDGTFDAALVHFKAAYAAAPNYRVLYNIGQTSLKLADYAGAESALDRYLSEGGSDLPADRRAAVTEDLEKIRRRIATITLTTNETRGEVLVDDAPAGHLPLRGPLRVNGGRRKISVVPDGSPAVSRVVEAPGGDALTVELIVPKEGSAAPAPAVPVPPTASPPAETPARASPTGAWITLGVGGALAAGAAVFGVLALGARSDAKAALDRYPGSRSALDDAQNRLATDAAVADVLGGLAVVAGGVGVTWLLLDRSTGSAGQSRVDLKLGPSGATATGRF
ncbi:MAG: hypothetical protein U0235_34980 [Polyangiaceae bacterium]